MIIKAPEYNAHSAHEKQSKQHNTRHVCLVKNTHCSASGIPLYTIHYL